ncbi:MAG: class I SAM-dependent methyltransferase [Gammaproteobacteria bacterium]|nr:class I SAM-dependent methyltransferase [Gammaproteobacteria bacterium]
MREIDHRYRPLQPGTQIASTLHFRRIFDALFSAVEPKTICEIGLEGGRTTRHLVELAARSGGRYIGIDPALSPTLRTALSDTPHVTLHASSSLDVLEHIAAPGLTIIDGDHNYHTVSRELELLAAAANHAEHASWAIALHDTSWPCSRRDTYYSPQRVPASMRHESSTRHGFSILDEALTKDGYGANQGLAIATRWGGEHNGVLTALEDFLQTRNNLQVLHIQALHGLSIVAPATPSTALAEVLGEIRVGLQVFGELLAEMEFNRLRLINDVRHSWQRRLAASLRSQLRGLLSLRGRASPRTTAR